MRNHDYTGETNTHGVKCLSQKGDRVYCVCACGAHFDTSVGNFDRTHGCKACRDIARRKRVNENRRLAYEERANNSESIGRGGKRGRPSTEMMQEELNWLEPTAMWRRICERHRNRESDISEIASRRRST